MGDSIVHPPEGRHVSDTSGIGTADGTRLASIGYLRNPLPGRCPRLPFGYQNLAKPLILVGDDGLEPPALSV
jgi:hypothetical protein